MEKRSAEVLADEVLGKLGELTARDKDNAVLGASALGVASPFAGMIGQKKIVSDPHVNTDIPRMSRRKLQQTAQAGDVVISSRPNWEGFKITQAPFSGTEFYHATPVVDRVREGGRVMDAGDFSDVYGDKPSVASLKRNATLFGKHFRDHDYADLVLLRPDKNVTSEQRKALLDAYAKSQGQAYSTPKGIKAMLKDLFLPKLRNASPEAVAKSLADSCAGDAQMCSSFPSEAAARSGINANIAKGKVPTEVLPADFLREGSGYSPVGSVVGQQRVYNNFTRRLMPVASRLGVGLGVGGAIYGGYNSPEATAGVVAGGLAPGLIRGAMSKRYQRSITDMVPMAAKREAAITANEVLPSFVYTLMQGKNYAPTLKKDIGRFLTRTAPVALGVGGGAYLGVSKLREHLQRNKEETNG